MKPKYNTDELLKYALCQIEMGAKRIDVENSDYKITAYRVYETIRIDITPKSKEGSETDD